MYLKQLLLLLGILVINSVFAVELSDNGQGQVLLFPYYNTEKGFISKVSVTNHGEQASVARIRILEGENGWLTLLANLYIAPSSTWGGEIAMDNDGVARITDIGSGCSVPQIGSSGHPLHSILINNSSDEKKFYETNERLGQGRIEVIEQGTIFNADIIKEIQNNSCNKLYEEWQSGDWANSPDKGLIPPEGKLSGKMELTSSYHEPMTYSATAIENFWSYSRLFGNLLFDGGPYTAHTKPGVELNLLGSVFRNGTKYDLSDTTSKVPELWLLTSGFEQCEPTGKNFKKTISSNWENSVDAISALLMSTSQCVEYMNEPALNTSSEMILSLPTRHYYVNKPSSVQGALSYNKPFTSVINNTSYACEPISTSINNAPAINRSLCFEITRVGFSHKNLFSDNFLAGVIDTRQNKGSFRMNFSGEMISKEGHVYKGLPVIALEAMAYDDYNTFSTGLQKTSLNKSSATVKYPK